MKILNARPMVRMLAGAEWAAVEHWDSTRFKASGASLIVAIHRVATVTRNKSTRIIALKAQAHINRTLQHVLDRVHHKALDISAMWADAVQQVLDSIKGDIRQAIEPEVRSVVGQGWSKTRILLGNQFAPLPGADDLAHGVLDKSSTIDATTGERIMNAVRRGSEEGLTGGALETEVRLAVSAQTSARSMTIGRSVAQDAWSVGSGEALGADGGVTHVSVIGCTKREWVEDWMWPQPGDEGDGRSPEPTCNIRDVPVEFVGELQFHPNHTGTIVPSAWQE